MPESFLGLGSGSVRDDHSNLGLRMLVGVGADLYFSESDMKVGRAVALWLRHYATNRQVAGSIPDGVTGIFQ